MQAAEPSGKIEEAKTVIEKCRTSYGFRASVDLYPELWIRDLAYSEDALLRLGHAETVRRHLESFVKLQRKDGNLPTVISASWRRVLNQRFHFWTCDTEILFVLAAFRYASYARDDEFLNSIRGPVGRCASFVAGRLNSEGLIPGCDWRDAIIGLEERCLLSNQIQLAGMYDKLGESQKADALRKTIRKLYYLPGEGYFADSVWWRNGTLFRDSRFDCLGSALGVLDGTIAGNDATGTSRGFMVADSGTGYRNVSTPYEVSRIGAFRSIHSVNAFVRNGAWLRNGAGHYQNSAVWPFVEARVVAAFRKLGLSSEAKAASDRMRARSGLHEWYSPHDGKPHGSSGQLWTAAAILTQV